MKSLVSTIVALLLIFTGLISCEKDKLPPNTVTPPAQETPSDSLDTTANNCGCGDLDSIPVWTGTIRYKIAPHPDDTSTHHKFWITVNSGSIYTHLIVCNKILPQEILNLKENVDTTTKLNIIFTGNLKKLCKPIPAGASDLSQVYYNIVLTKIEVQ